MKTKNWLFPGFSRSMDIFDDSIEIEVRQGVNIDDCTLQKCEITIERSKVEDVNTVKKCLDFAKKQADVWNVDAGKPARDVLR